MIKHPIHLLIKAFENGMSITDGQGITYCFSDRNRLSMLISRHKDGVVCLETEGEECFELDFSFNSMMAFAEKLPEETVVALASAIAIKEMKDEKIQT